jgi:hypothetical protein
MGIHFLKEIRRFRECGNAVLVDFQAADVLPVPDDQRTGLPPFDAIEIHVEATPSGTMIADFQMLAIEGYRENLLRLGQSFREDRIVIMAADAFHVDEKYPAALHDNPDVV